MTLQDLLAAGPKMLPLIPRLERAVATAERVANDPDVKDALAAFEEAAAILASAVKPAAE